MTTFQNGDSGFLRTLSEFQSDLSEEEKAHFQICSLQDVSNTIGDIQDEQKRTKTYRNLKKIKPFLEAIGQLGEVIEVFLNASEFVSLIWVCIIITCSGPYIGLLIDSRVPSN